VIAYLQRLKSLVENGPSSPLATMFALQTEGLFSWYYGGLDEAALAFRHCISIGESTGVQLLEPTNVSYLGQVALMAGDAEVVSECSLLVDRMTLFRPSDELARIIFLGRVQIAQGKAEDALAGLEEGARLCQNYCTVNARPPLNLVKAEAFRAVSRRSSAFRALVVAFRGARQNRQLEFACLLMFAQLHLDSSQRSRAVAALKRGFGVGRQIEARRTYSCYGPPFAALCAEALEAKIEVDYVQSLVRHNRLTPPPGAEAVDAWPWPIRVYAFGPFEIYLDGERLRAGRKAQRKPLDLLKALIAFGSRDVPETRFWEALWPEATGDAAHKAFEITLHRLRSLLGDKDALLLDEGRLTLDPNHCWVDARAFERLVVYGRDAGYPAPPVRTQACSFPALGSSGVLASALPDASLQHRFSRY